MSSCCVWPAIIPDDADKDLRTGLIDMVRPANTEEFIHIRKVSVKTGDQFREPALQLNLYCRIWEPHMTNSFIKTDKAPPPFSAYSQAVQTPPGARIVHVSGQVGVTPSGTLPGDAEQQHQLAWKNVFAILDAANMDKNDIVDVRAFIKDHDQVPIYREVRDRMLEGAIPASTLVVAGLANPDWLVEIAVTAAKVDF